MKNLNASEDYISIDDSQVKQLKIIIINNLNVLEILEKINPKLKSLYEQRQIKSDENPEAHSKIPESQLIKISKEKMNNEERLLTALLSNTNLNSNLNDILEYLSDLLLRVKETNKNKIQIIENHENCLIDTIMKCGVNSFYSFKIKLLTQDDEIEDDSNESNVVNENNKKMTEEEIKKELEEFERYPIFMKDIPQNLESNEHLRALQALKFEGKPEDVALEFAEKSKESFEKYKSDNKFIDLKESFYYITNAIDHIKDDSTIPDKIKHNLYLSRAELQIFVKNKGHAIDDVKSALFYVETDEAFLILIEIYTSMEAFDKALKIISQRKKKFLEFPEINLKLYTLQEQKIKILENDLLNKLQKCEAFKNIEDREKIKLYDLLNKRGIKLKPQIHNIPQNVEAKIYLDDENKLHFPILVIYEEFNTTDYIQDVIEDTFVIDILDILFAGQEFLPWGSKYSLNTLSVFYEISEFDSVMKTHISSYFPLRNDNRLIDILRKPKVFMNGFPVFVIVSNVSSHFQHFIKSKKIIKRTYDI